MIRLLRAFQMLVLVGSYGVLLFVVFYCIQNSSGHTGMEPRLIGLPFLGVFVFGVLSISFSATRGFASGALLVVGISGMAIGFFIHTMTILMRYELWLSAGMPAQNKFTTIWMLAYAGVTTFFMIYIGRSQSHFTNLNTATFRAD